FHVAGQPQQRVPLGSFEVWSRCVRDALVWLGEPDPCATMEQSRTSDPRTQALAEVLHQWMLAVGASEVTVKRAIEIAIERKGEPHHQAADASATAPPPREFKNPEF